ncbi:MAG: wax ester/triacylglycerol synthase family O-acyltransferase [Candidatus Cyclonatronum sp.]|uniref:wax ester/triacylglycerol synthase family O-acyltransferase n=1 Tax=Cyclonatronum sp. TaxID=3024185 RepID=UPI0025C57F63|nr:wax ester/triacylglycerol synthase family O-acyltransferase [Cyclonatronum sp.]MCH8487840.1 wax ester/triacylglycerol synthase family O-acyltransferase [Cyclonatronum sp.]
MSQVSAQILRAEVLSGADSAWLRMEQPENQMVITGMLQLSNRPGCQAFRELIRQRLLIFARFRQRVINRETIPLWVPDENIDLDYHLRQVDLRKSSTELTLHAYIEKLLSIPLDFDRPLWELHLVETAGGTTLVAKLHHCIADGIALVRILLSLTTVAPGGAFFEPHREYKPVRRTGQRHSGLFNSAGDGIRRITKALYKFVSMPADTATHVKGALQPLKKAAWSASVPLVEVKFLAAKYKATINDILLWLACGALRRYLTEAGEKPETASSFRVSIPVNLRGDTDTLMTGNQFGLVFLELPVGIENGQERLRIVQRRMNEIKASGEAWVAYGVLSLLGKMPLIVEQFIVNFLSSKCSAVVTNVPGPRRPLYLAGAKIEEIMFWVPKSGMLGVGISLISYNGGVSIGVASDANRLPQPEKVTQYFVEMFETEKTKAL